MRFPTTSWTLVKEVREHWTEDPEALNRLCMLYWRPVFVFLRRMGRWGRFSAWLAASIWSSCFPFGKAATLLDEIQYPRGILWMGQIAASIGGFIAVASSPCCRKLRYLNT